MFINWPSSDLKWKKFQVATATNEYGNAKNKHEIQIT